MSWWYLYDFDNCLFLCDSHKLPQILCSQKWTRGFSIITDCRMQLIYLQFSRFKAGVNSQYHAKRNQNLEAIMKNHQHQARIARISRPILPQSNRAEDLATWRVAQVLFILYPLTPPTGAVPFSSLLCLSLVGESCFRHDAFQLQITEARKALAITQLPEEFQVFLRCSKTAWMPSQN